MGCRDFQSKDLFRVSIILTSLLLSAFAGPGAVGSSVKPKCGYQAKLSYEGCGAW